MRSFALLVLLLSLLLAGGAAPAPAAAPAPTAVGIGAREFSFSVYRTTVKPGAVRFNLTNFGEDGHDLTVLAPGGRVAAHLTEVEGFGGRGSVEVRLTKAGRYRLLCTVADHAQRGMKATVRVRR